MNLRALRKCLFALAATLLATSAAAHDYRYMATVRSCYDADTCRLDISLGLGITAQNVQIRLYGIDAPELRGDERPEGLAARDALLDRTSGRRVLLQTVEDDTGKYGRLLGILWLDGENMNEWLVERGYAEEADY